MVCSLVQRVGLGPFDFAHILQDYSGRDGGRSNGVMTIKEEPVEVQSLVNYVPASGLDGTINVDISVQKDNQSERTLSFTIEGERGIPPYSMHSLKVRVPETVWIDYGGITKFIASFDGIYYVYAPDFEERTYDERATFDFILSLFSVSDAFDVFGIRSLLETLGNSDVHSAGKYLDNCSDEANILTLMPALVHIAESRNRLPKRLRIEIPFYSLTGDDYMTLTYANSTFGFGATKEYNDLLKSGRGVPACERP